MIGLLAGKNEFLSWDTVCSCLTVPDVSVRKVNHRNGYGKCLLKRTERGRERRAPAAYSCSGFEKTERYMVTVNYPEGTLSTRARH